MGEPLLLNKNNSFIDTNARLVGDYLTSGRTHLQVNVTIPEPEDSRVCHFHVNLSAYSVAISKLMGIDRSVRPLLSLTIADKMYCPTSGGFHLTEYGGSLSAPTKIPSI